MAKNLSREYIFESFYKLLEKKHYDDITVGEICAKAGVSRMSFYRLFASKEDLAVNGVKEVCNEMKVNIEKLEKPNSYLVIRTIFETIKVYSKIFHSFKDAGFLKSWEENIATEIEAKLPSDYIVQNSKYYPIFYFSAVSSVIMVWLKNGAVETPDEMAKLLTPLLNGVFVKKNSYSEDDNSLDSEE